MSTPTRAAIEFPAGDAWPRWLGRLASLVVLAVGAWLLAAIGWQLVPSPPSPPPAAPGAPVDVAHDVAARQLLGKMAAMAAPTTGGDGGFRLLGVIAGGGQTPGVALVQASGESKPKVVAEGGEVAAGVRLLRVEQRQVLLSQNGREVGLKLPEAGRQQPASPSRPN